MGRIGTRPGDRNDCRTNPHAAMRPNDSRIPVLARLLGREPGNPVPVDIGPHSTRCRVFETGDLRVSLVPVRWWSPAPEEVGCFVSAKRARHRTGEFS